MAEEQAQPEEGGESPADQDELRQDDPEASEASETEAQEVAEDPDGLETLRERGEVEEAEGAAPEEPDAMELPELATAAAAGAGGNSIDLLMDVDLEVKIELGRAEMAIEDILKLKKGSVVELDKLAGDPVDILVNDRLVAKGEILVVNDNFCVRIAEISDPEASLRRGREDG